MSFNFFTWIREGVKQSVLMGVHDAVEHMGPRPDEDPIGDRLMGFLQSDQGTTATRQLGGPKKRKLGRTLKEIQAEAGKAT